MRQSVPHRWTIKVPVLLDLPAQLIERMDEPLLLTGLGRTIL